MQGCSGDALSHPTCPGLHSSGYLTLLPPAGALALQFSEAEVDLGRSVPLDLNAVGVCGGRAHARPVYNPGIAQSRKLAVFCQQA